MSVDFPDRWGWVTLYEDGQVLTREDAKVCPPPSERIVAKLQSLMDEIETLKEDLRVARGGYVDPDPIEF